VNEEKEEKKKKKETRTDLLTKAITIRTCHLASSLSSATSAN